LPFEWIAEIAFGGGKFIAVNSAFGYTSYSSDGITWTEEKDTFGGTNPSEIAYGNGKYVAVGNSEIWYSTGL
jgi:hypothetical protein